MVSFGITQLGSGKLEDVAYSIWLSHYGYHVISDVTKYYWRITDIASFFIFFINLIVSTCKGVDNLMSCVRTCVDYGKMISHNTYIGIRKIVYKIRCQEHWTRGHPVYPFSVGIFSAEV